MGVAISIGLLNNIRKLRQLWCCNVMQTSYVFLGSLWCDAWKAKNAKLSLTSYRHPVLHSMLWHDAHSPFASVTWMLNTQQFHQSEGVCVAAQSGLGLCSVHMSSTQTVETCMNFSVLKRWHKLNHTELNYNIFGHERVVEIYDHHHHIARYRLSLTNSILILFIFMIRHIGAVHLKLCGCRST